MVVELATVTEEALEEDTMVVELATVTRGALEETRGWLSWRR